MYQPLISPLFAALDGVSPEYVREQCAVKGSRLNVLSRVAKRYMSAERAAGKFGLVGVGVISFADRRTELFIRRAGITL